MHSRGSWSLRDTRKKKGGKGRGEEGRTIGQRRMRKRSRIRRGFCQLVYSREEDEALETAREDDHAVAMTSTSPPSTLQGTSFSWSFPPPHLLAISPRQLLRRTFGELSSDHQGVQGWERRFLGEITRGTKDWWHPRKAKGAMWISQPVKSIHRASPQHPSLHPPLSLD